MKASWVVLRPGQEYTPGAYWSQARRLRPGRWAVARIIELADGGHGPTVMGPTGLCLGFYFSQAEALAALSLLDGNE